MCDGTAAHATTATSTNFTSSHTICFHCAAIKHTLMALLLRHVSIVHLTMLRVLSGPHEPRKYFEQGFHVPQMNGLSPPRHTPHWTQYCHLSCSTWKSMAHTEKMKHSTTKVFTKAKIQSYAQHKRRLEGVGEGCSTFDADLVVADVQISKRRVGLVKIADVHHGVARTCISRRAIPRRRLVRRLHVCHCCREVCRVTLCQWPAGCIQTIPGHRQGPRLSRFVA